MHNDTLVFVIVSFLTAALIYSSSHTFNALAEIKSSGIDCIPEKKPSNIVNCCYKEYDTNTGDTVAIYCTECYDNGTGNLACGPYEKVESIKPPDGAQDFPKDTAPPPVGVAPPPSSTQTCPENTALDANGNCAPVTQAPPSTDQGTTTIQPSPPSDDNKPLKHKLPKANILGELPQSEKQFTAKKKNNNDNSPTPPPCPTDNSPIPPNCTLKPKF